MSIIKKTKLYNKKDFTSKVLDAAKSTVIQNIEKMDFDVSPDVEIETASGVHDSFFDKYPGAKIGNSIIEKEDGSWVEKGRDVLPNSNQKCDKTIYHNLDGSQIVEYEYNNYNGGHDVIVKVYDSNGKLVDSDEFSGKYYKDENGNTVKIETSLDGKNVYMEEVTDKDGKLLSKIEYDSSGNIKYQYKVLEDGKIFESNYLNDFYGKLHYTETISDENGLIQKKEYDINKNLISITDKLEDGSTKYTEYDKNSKVSYESMTKDGIKQYTKYDGDNIVETGKNGVNGEREVIKYDNGQISSKYEKYSKGDEIDYTTTSYKNGNIIGETIKYKDGNSISGISREYENGFLKTERIVYSNTSGEWRYYNNGQLVKKVPYSN